MTDGIFGLVGARVDWLLAKQRVIGENIANANSPAYKARDIAPFDQVLSASRVRMTPTKNSLPPIADVASSIVERQRKSGEETVSGNAVNVQSELAGMAQVRAEYGLSTAVTKAFHRMYLLSVRSGG